VLSAAAKVVANALFCRGPLMRDRDARIILLFTLPLQLFSTLSANGTKTGLQSPHRELSRIAPRPS